MELQGTFSINATKTQYWPNLKLDSLGKSMLRPLLKLRNKLIRESLIHETIYISSDEEFDEDSQQDILDSSDSESDKSDYDSSFIDDSSEDSSDGTNNGELYATLAITQSATATEVKKAYHRLARIHHPDKSDNPQAEEIMKQLNHAYQTLSDPTLRKIYGNIAVVDKYSYHFFQPTHTMISTHPN